MRSVHLLRVAVVLPLVRANAGASDRLFLLETPSCLDRFDLPSNVKTAIPGGDTRREVSPEGAEEGPSPGGQGPLAGERDPRGPRAQTGVTTAAGVEDAEIRLGDRHRRALRESVCLPDFPRRLRTDEGGFASAVAGCVDLPPPVGPGEEQVGAAPRGAEHSCNEEGPAVRQSPDRRREFIIPTSENLARVVLEQVRGGPFGRWVHEVKLHESENNIATCTVER